MRRPRRRRYAPEGALAAVLGGAVTREQLSAAAAREGCAGMPLVRTLLRRYLPPQAELANVYSYRNFPARLEARVLRPAPQAGALLDPDLLARLCCVPLVILHDVCVLAVAPGREAEAVASIHAALRRGVIPVLADPVVIEGAIRGIPDAPDAAPHFLRPRRSSPTWERFENNVLRAVELEAIPLDKAAP